MYISDNDELYISDNEMNRKQMIKLAAVYLGVSVFCAVFGAVYEIFSHEVYSPFMMFAFAFPLLGGALPFFLLGKYGRGVIPGAVSRQLYHAGIAALTVGSILSGVLEIYGTTNGLVGYYWIVGGALTYLGLMITGCGVC